MNDIGIIGLCILIANVFVSYRGFTNEAFFDKYLFRVDDILIGRDYKRLVTSGFLHVSWTHLIFNMLSFYAFSYALEETLGPVQFIIIYFGSLIGGSLFSLFIHRHHGDYSAVGASGAVSGLIFASIGLFPGMGIGFFGLPFSIPGWAYGLFYVLFSIYGIRSKRDNIGHEAHLGGGIIGLLIGIAMFPTALKINYLPILLIVVPASVFIYIIATHPGFLLVDNYFKKEPGFQTIEDKYNTARVEEQKELDALLDKIGRRGMNSLTKKEREALKRHSDRRS